MAFADQESVTIWGRNRENNAKRLLLSYPANVDYTSCMVDVCIPDNMKDVKLVLKSSGNAPWSEGSYVTVFDCVKQTPLLSTTLSQPEERSLAFPRSTCGDASPVVGTSFTALDIHVTVPTPDDRALVALWGFYSGVSTMVGIVYNPFPYYQHVIKRVLVVSNNLETYEVRFVNAYRTAGFSGMRIAFSLEEKLLGEFTPSAQLRSFSLRTPLFCEQASWKMLQMDRTAANATWELLCADGRVGYRRRCGEAGEWEAVEGEGCSCAETRDAFGITWRRVGGGTVIQRACELPFEGSVVMRCSLRGVWERQEAACVRRQCPEEATAWERSAGLPWARTNANETAVQRCANGDVMRERHCSLLGTWEAVKERPCSCGRDRAGEMEWSATQGGDTASLPCHPGYEGQITRACSREGRWGEVTDRCARLFCPAVKDRSVLYPRTPSGEVIDVECPLPYVGRIERVCQLDGRWGYVEDFCRAPSCEHVKVARGRRGCVVVHVDDAGAGEQVGVQVLPFLSEESSIVVSPLPASVCNLATNQPYEVTVYRYAGTTVASACVVSNVYAVQQCEVMAAPVLRSVSVNTRGLARVAVMVEAPFCYDLVLSAVQVKVTCVQGCDGKRPLLLSHACREDGCQPGSYIIISTQFVLDLAQQYSIVTKPMVAASLLALQQTWSEPLLTSFHGAALPSSKGVKLAQSIQATQDAQSGQSVQVNQDAQAVQNGRISQHTQSTQSTQSTQGTQSSQSLQVVVGEVTATPKSTHSARLAWAFSVNGKPLPCSNYLIHVFVSSVLDDTRDPRYLTRLDSLPVCKESEICTRNTVIVPIARNGLRFVIIVEPVPVCAFGLLVKNTTTAFVVPDLPAVDSTVTNYDHYANVTFSRANMDVAVNCTVLTADHFFVGQFALFVDYGEEVAHVIYGLRSQTHYTVACWVRDGFVEPRLFSLAVNTIEEVPTTPSIRLVDSTLHYAKVEMRSNHEGRFSCQASLLSEAEVEAVESVDALQAHNSFSLFYSTPQHAVMVMIPMGIAFSASFASQVLVLCSFAPADEPHLAPASTTRDSVPHGVMDGAATSHGVMDGAATSHGVMDGAATSHGATGTTATSHGVMDGTAIPLKCSAPLHPRSLHSVSLLLVPYHPRILHRSVNTRSAIVSSHSIITLSFEAPVLLKRGYGYFFYLVPIRGLGSYYHDHREAWTRDCKKSSGHNTDCATVDGQSSYTPPIILSEECACNATILTIPLPQIDSNIRYGLKMSLPDMIVDGLANTALDEATLEEGFLFTFTSNTEGPRIFARLVQPADVHNASLSEPIVIQYSSAGFSATGVPIQLRRQFGETVLEAPIGHDCVSKAQDEKDDTTTISIDVERCLRSLLPLTNYEVFIPSTAWAGGTAESPSSFLFSFFTRDEFVSPLLVRTASEEVSRNGRTSMEFDQPVRVGSGAVRAEIADLKNPLIVYHTQEEPASEVFSAVDNPFVVWVNLTRFSFYPYATYRLHWEEGALLTTRGLNTTGGSVSFSTVDESCRGRVGSSNAPMLCKYYSADQQQLCYCFHLF